MAVAAEQFDHVTFDRHYYETQRRLNLAPSIGSVALSSEFVDGLEKRRRDEVVDGIAEAIPGVVYNLRQYEMKDGRLVAENGQDMEELLLNGFKDAVREAAKDSFYAPFRPVRARHELDEVRLWQEMATGQTGYNTLQIISPFSEEYCNDATKEKLQLAGQEPGSKRAMLRIAHWDGNRLNVQTLSIDNSSLELLKLAAKNTDGYEYQALNTNDMLGERRSFNMRSMQEATEFADRLTSKADELIEARMGGQRKQGRLVSEAYDTQRHVESEVQIINHLMHVGRLLAGRCASYEEYEVLWHEELRKHTALIKERMVNNDIREIVDVGGAAYASGEVAAARGETYNMCGLVLSANGQASAGEGTGFESIKNLIGKKVTCPECKEKVVIPTNKLTEGRLCCPDCKYEVDVCTGQVYSKSTSSSRVGRGSKSSGVYAMIADGFRKDMQRIDMSISEHRQRTSANPRVSQLRKTN